MRTKLLAVAACAMLGVAAASASVSSADPKLMVLRLNDLPVGFERVSGYYASNAQAAKEFPTTTLADYIRWGRITGYEEEFRRSAIGGLIDVASAASTYRTTLGAGRSLYDSYRNAPKDRFHRLSLGRPVGNDSRFYSYRTKQSGFPLIVYTVVWRWKTVKAILTAGGIEGTVRPEIAVALARKQQTRIRAEVP